MSLLLLLPLVVQMPGSADIMGPDITGPDITGPAEVRGVERGSLTVLCRYGPGWEKYVKWWCRGADWGSCKILVKTDRSEQKSTKNRVSIWDHHRNHTFTVTMKELTEGDADNYWCGIERTGTDLGVPVKVTVLPVPTATVTSTTTSTAPVTLEDTTVAAAVTGHHSDGSGLFMNLSILLPVLSALLLLLLAAASLLAWRVVNRQKKAAGTSPEQVLQPPEGELCYANLTLQRTEMPSSSRKRGSKHSSCSARSSQMEVDYVTMAPLPRQDLSYASLSLDTSDQDPTYINSADLITHLPTSSQGEVTEYSAIRKP